MLLVPKFCCKSFNLKEGSALCAMIPIALLHLTASLWRFGDVHTALVSVLLAGEEAVWRGTCSPMISLLLIYSFYVSVLQSIIRPSVFARKAKP